jgi:hypothetical protein
MHALRLFLLPQSNNLWRFTTKQHPGGRTRDLNTSNTKTCHEHDNKWVPRPVLTACSTKIRLNILHLCLGLPSVRFAKSLPPKVLAICSVRSKHFDSTVHTRLSVLCKSCSTSRGLISSELHDFIHLRFKYFPELFVSDTCSYCLLKVWDNDSQPHKTTRWQSTDVSEMFAAPMIRAMMVEAVSTSETSVNFYNPTRRNNSEDRHLHTRKRENLKFWKNDHLIYIWCSRGGEDIDCGLLGCVGLPGLTTQKITICTE